MKKRREAEWLRLLKLREKKDANGGARFKDPLIDRNGPEIEDP